MRRPLAMVAVTVSLLLLCVVGVRAHTPHLILHEDGSAVMEQVEHTKTELPSMAALAALYPVAASARHSPSLSRPSLYANLANPNAAIAARAQQSLNCSVCTTLVGWVEPLLFKNTTEGIIEALAVWYCENDLKPLCTGKDQCAQVCTGIISEHAAEVFELIKEIGTPEMVCAALKQCPAPPPSPIPTGIPVKSNLKNLNGEREWASWSRTEGTGTFLHLSDAHMDPTYTPNTNVNCGLPICCHSENGAGTAGYWGDYQCDTSPQLAQNLLEYLSKMTPSPDFVLYTGDDPSHDVWKQSRAENLNALGLWSSLINNTLAAPLNIPVFHTLGNHEIYPINQFAGPGYDSWLYDAAVANWAPFLPEDAQATMSYGGYYQARVRPGLRVISLNSNYFTSDNFWLLANSTDCYDQLNWAADVLEQASALGEKAIVICHHPIKSWETNIAKLFLNISETYQSTIVNYFMGHTHNNEYATLASAAGVPMHVAYVAGSVVPFTDLNPGFSEFAYDREVVDKQSDYQHLVQEAYAHWMVLPEANQNNDTDAQWGVIRTNYTAAYGVSLDAKSMRQLAPSYLTNTALYQAYINTQNKGVNTSSPDSPQEIMCVTSSNTDADYHACLHGKGLTETDIQKREGIAHGKC